MTEDYIVVKQRVNDLIKAGALAFDDEDILDVNRNPLPDHQRPKVNVVESDPKLLVERMLGLSVCLWKGCMRLCSRQGC